MKKLLLFPLLFLPFLLPAQIPNAGFESWEMFPGFEEPTDWVTNNDPCCVSVTRSDNAHTGDYALNLINNGPSFEGPLPGYASVTFASTVNANTVGFQARCDTISGTGLGVVQVFGRIGTYFEEIGSWQTDTTIGEYTYFEITTPPFLNYDSIRIVITASAMNDPLGSSTGHADLTIDDLTTEFTTGISEMDDTGSPLIYPNPSSWLIHVQDPEGSIRSVQIFNADGRLVRELKVNSGTVVLDMAGEAPGTYMLKTIHRNGLSTARRIILDRE